MELLVACQLEFLSRYKIPSFPPPPPPDPILMNTVATVVEHRRLVILSEFE